MAMAGTRSTPVFLHPIPIENEVHFFDRDVFVKAGSSSSICRVCRHVSQSSVCVKNSSRTGRSSRQTIRGALLVGGGN